MTFYKRCPGCGNAEDGYELMRHRSCGHIACYRPKGFMHKGCGNGIDTCPRCHRYIAPLDTVGYVESSLSSRHTSHGPSALSVVVVLLILAALANPDKKPPPPLTEATNRPERVAPVLNEAMAPAGQAASPTEPEGGCAAPTGASLAEAVCACRRDGDPNRDRNCTNDDESTGNKVTRAGEERS